MTIRVELAQTEAPLLALRSQVRQLLAAMDDAVANDGQSPEDLRVQTVEAALALTRAARTAVLFAFDVAPSSSVYLTHPLQRCLRDILDGPEARGGKPRDLRQGRPGTVSASQVTGSERRSEHLPSPYQTTRKGHQMTRKLPPARKAPYKLAHVVLRVRDVDASVNYYQQLLGAWIVSDQRPFAAGLTFDEEHHRLALIGVPDAPVVADTGAIDASSAVTDAQGADLDGISFSTTAGLEHIAFTFDSLGSLLATYVEARDAGLRPTYCVNHGPTVSLYYTDPDGNKTELQIDSMPMEIADDWIHSDEGRANVIGWPFDPEDLLERYLSGESLAGLIAGIGRTFAESA